MHRVLGLSCDPFGPTWEDALYWESPARKRVREDAREALRGGRSVWLQGVRGSGRETLTRKIALDLALERRAVLFADAACPSTEYELLARLCTVAGAAPSDAGSTGLAEGLYRRVLRAFCRTAPVVVVPSGAPSDGVPAAELEMLAGLRLAGHPIAALLAWGDGEPPFEGFQTFEIATPPESELRACLSHRLAACGAPDLLSSDELEINLDGVRGFEEALERGRLALCRLVFERTAQETTAQALAPTAGPFDPTEVGEVGRLLDSL